jgi:hypothetical protein
MKTPPERLVVNVPEAGAMAGLSRVRSYAAVKDGSMPTVKVAGRLRVPLKLWLAMLGGAERPEVDWSELLRIVNEAARALDPDRRILAAARLLGEIDALWQAGQNANRTEIVPPAAKPVSHPILKH